jgi:hypothetical protein
MPPTECCIGQVGGLGLIVYGGFAMIVGGALLWLLATYWPRR